MTTPSAWAPPIPSSGLARRGGRSARRARRQDALLLVAASLVGAWFGVTAPSVSPVAPAPATAPATPTTTAPPAPSPALQAVGAGRAPRPGR